MDGIFLPSGGDMEAQSMEFSTLRRVVTLKGKPEDYQVALVLRGLSMHKKNASMVEPVLELAGSESPTMRALRGEASCDAAAMIVLRLSVRDGQRDVRRRHVAWLRQDLEEVRSEIGDPLRGNTQITERAIQILTTSQPIAEALDAVLARRESVQHGPMSDLLLELLSFDDVLAAALMELAAGRMEQPALAMRKVLSHVAAGKVSPARSAEPRLFPALHHMKGFSNARSEKAAQGLLATIDAACLKAPESSVRISRLCEIAAADRSSADALNQAMQDCALDGAIDHLIDRLTHAIPPVPPSGELSEWGRSVASLIRPVRNARGYSETSTEMQLKLCATLLRMHDDLTKADPRLQVATTLLIAVYVAQNNRCPKDLHDEAISAAYGKLLRSHKGAVGKSRLHPNKTSLYLREIVAKRVSDICRSHQSEPLPAPRNLGDLGIAEFKPIDGPDIVTLGLEDLVLNQSVLRASRVGGRAPRKSSDKGTSPRPILLLQSADSPIDSGEEYLVRVIRAPEPRASAREVWVEALAPCTVEEHKFRCLLQDHPVESGTFTKLLADRMDEIDHLPLYRALHEFFGRRKRKHDYVAPLLYVFCDHKLDLSMSVESRIKKASTRYGVSFGSLKDAYYKFREAVLNEPELRHLLQDENDPDPNQPGPGKGSFSPSRKKRMDNGIPPSGFDNSGGGDGSKHPSNHELAGVARAVLIERRALNDRELRIESHVMRCDCCEHRYESIVADILTQTKMKPALTLQRTTTPGDDPWDAEKLDTRNLVLKAASLAAALFIIFSVLAVMIPDDDAVHTASLIDPEPVTHRKSDTSSDTYSWRVFNNGAFVSRSIDGPWIFERESHPHDLSSLAMGSSGPRGLVDVTKEHRLPLANARTTENGIGFTSRSSSDSDRLSVVQVSSKSLDSKSVSVVFDDDSRIELETAFSTFLHGILSQHEKSLVRSSQTSGTRIMYSVTPEQLLPWMRDNTGPQAENDRLHTLDQEYLLRALLARAMPDQEILVARKVIEWGDQAYEAIESFRTQQDLPEGNYRDDEFIERLLGVVSPDGLCIEISMSTDYAKRNYPGKNH